MNKGLLNQCLIEPIAVGGPGGQNRNRTYSGIRLTHLPTGIRVTATERSSQSANKAIALERLETKLLKAAHKPKSRVATKRTKASREKRLESKSRRSEIKSNRKRIQFR